MIVESLADYLTTNAAITALTTDIRPQVLSDGHNDPAMTYQMVDNDAIRTQDGLSELYRASFILNTYSISYAGSRSLAAAVRSELESLQGAMGTNDVDQIDFNIDIDRFETPTKLHSVSLTCEIWYR